MAMRYFKIVFLLLFGHFATAQVSYFNTQFDYKHYWEAAGYSSVETDSFYLLPASFGTPWIDILDTAFVLKINKYDATLNYKKIDFFEGQRAVNICRTAHPNRFLLQGRKYPGHSGPNVDTDIYLCYLDAGSLDTSNMNIYGLPGRNDNFYRPIHTSDGGFFSSGWSFVTPTGRQSIILFKCDSNLNQQFFKLYPQDPLEDYGALGLVETPDKGIIIVGSKRQNIYNDNAIVFKVDTLGNIKWWKEWSHNGDTTNVYFQDIVPKGDGTYLLIGNRRFDPQVGPAHETFWVVNMDGNGKILWWKEHDPNFYAGWQTITPSLDGNFYASGVATEYNPDFPSGFVQYAVISKLSPNGDLLWHKKYTMSPSSKYYDIFFNVLATSDGGILCNGTTYEDDTTRQNAWIVKLDGNGCIGPGPGCSTDTGEPIVLPVGKNSWISISPNPTGGLVRITTNGEHRIEAVRVFDTAGRMIQQESSLDDQELWIDLSRAPPGGYVFSVLVDGVLTARQVVKS